MRAHESGLTRMNWMHGLRWMRWTLAIALLAGGCSAGAGEKGKKTGGAEELVASLRQKQIPGLPDPLTPQHIKEIETARAGPGGWFVEKGCFGCHAVSVYGVKSYSQVGPDLSTAVSDVQSRFGTNIDEFWKQPVGTMMMVRSQLLKLTPEEEAVGLEKLKAAFAEYQKQHGATAQAR